MPIQCTCSICGATFSRVRATVGPYCSMRCTGEGNRRKLPVAPTLFDDDGVTARIPLYSKGGVVRAYTLVDASDAEWVNQWRWYLSHLGYVIRKKFVDGRWVGTFLHRELLGLEHGSTPNGDHIDRKRLNNRRNNLRVVHRKDNPQNRSSVRGSSSQYRGVSLHRANGKWKAAVKVKGKEVYLGYFTDEHEAGRAAQDARLRLLPYAVD